MPPPINLIVILAAAVFSMIIGMIWYSPMLFGKYWMFYSGVSARKSKLEKKRNSVNTVYAISFVGSLVTAYVLAYFLYYTGSTTAFEGAKKGAMMWAGFVLTAMAAGVLYENRPKELLVINSAYQLISLMVMGAILAVWA
ncbi:MAG: DUF1761 domain-containing protein [Candidatus Aenigmarchaeota archaeon]|nr:DUF1761 domain-containing protein [Candidatus Aenigmarchaeota archaeon]